MNHFMYKFWCILKNSLLSCHTSMYFIKMAVMKIDVKCRTAKPKEYT